MQKGLGIAALVIGILALFVPFAGSWLTILVAILAAFATGEGFGLGIAAILISVIHIFIFSPLLWTTEGLLSAGSAINGTHHIVFLPWILVGVQVIALVMLVILNNKRKIQSTEAVTPTPYLSQKENIEPETSHVFHSDHIIETFDQAKWEALLKYDKDIALTADRLQPLGQKWVDEFASSYLALNDKQYLSDIEHKIVVDAKREVEVKEQEAIAAARLLEEQKEQQRVYLREQESRQKERSELWRNRLIKNKSLLIITGLSIVFLIMIATIIELWQMNLKIKEDERHLAEERSQVYEAHSKFEDERAKELTRIIEMQKSLVEKNAQMKEFKSLSIPNTIASNENQQPIQTPPINPTRSNSNSQTQKETALKNIDQHVKKMLDGAMANDENLIQENKQYLENQPKPPKGDKKAARKINEEALKLIQNQQYDHAVPLFAKAADTDPSDVEILNNYGFVLMKSRDLDKALSVLTKALTIKPDRASAWANLADVLALQGHVDSATAGYMNVYRFSKNREKTYMILQNPQLHEDSPYVREALANAVQKITP